MIDFFDPQILALNAATSFGELIAAAAGASTGMDFVVQPVGGGPAAEVVTSHPEAVRNEYGAVDSPGGSWSVKAILEAERRLNEHASGGI